MHAIINGTKYDTELATTVYEWADVTLYQTAVSRQPFLHHHEADDTERITLISIENAIVLLRTQGNPQAIDLLNKPMV
ncbi:hypothetical protein ACFL6U_26995 [Planctomycetota bacterium]